MGPNDGWFNYVPYATRAYNPGLNEDFYALGMMFLGISTTVGAANFIVTALRTRAPGMSINRLPILMWGTLTASAANLARGARRQPCLLAAVDGSAIRHAFLRRVAAAASRCCGSICSGCSGIRGFMRSFCPRWAWCRMRCRYFCRRPLVGYAPVALSTVATMILGFGVWVHHMFATGLPNLALSFFSGASIAISRSECSGCLRLDRDDLGWGGPWSPRHFCSSPA